MQLFSAGIILFSHGQDRIRSDTLALDILITPFGSASNLNPDQEIRTNVRSKTNFRSPEPNCHSDPI